MNFVKPSMSLVASAASCVPVRTSVSGGKSGAIASTSCSGDTPSRAAAWMPSSLPSFANSCWAVATSKTANVALPIESTEPNLATPTIVNRSTGPFATTPISSPTS